MGVDVKHPCQEGALGKLQDLSVGTVRTQARGL